MFRKEDKIESTYNPYCNRYIINPCLSAMGKFAGVSLVTQALSPPGGMIIPSVAGGLAAVTTWISRYIITTKANISPGIMIKAQDKNVVTTLDDEFKAGVIIVASLTDAIVQAYQVFLTSNKQDPHLLLMLIIVNAYNQWITGIFANGQKWFGEQNKNINDTWIGYIFNLCLTLDIQGFRENIIDVKSLFVTLKTTVEVFTEFANNYSACMLLGLNHSMLLLPLVLASTHATFYARRGFEQRIMQASLETENRSQQYLSLGIIALGKAIDKAVDMAAIPFDLLSCLIPPKYVIHGSNMIAGLLGGYSLFSQGIDNLPSFLKNIFDKPYCAYPVIVGATGVYVYAKITSLTAAWEHQLIVRSESIDDSYYDLVFADLNQNSELQSEQKPFLSLTSSKSVVGVAPLLQEKFGDIQEQNNICYREATKLRFKSYKDYLQKNYNHHAITSKIRTQYSTFFSSKNDTEKQNGMNTKENIEIVIFSETKLSC